MDINQFELALVADGQVIHRGNLESIKGYIALSPRKPGKDLGIECITPLKSKAEMKMFVRVLKAHGLAPKETT